MYTGSDSCIQSDSYHPTGQSVGPGDRAHRLLADQYSFTLPLNESPNRPIPCGADDTVAVLVDVALGNSEHVHVGL